MEPGKEHSSCLQPGFIAMSDNIIAVTRDTRQKENEMKHTISSQSWMGHFTPLPYTTDSAGGARGEGSLTRGHNYFAMP